MDNVPDLEISLEEEPEALVSRNREVMYERFARLPFSQTLGDGFGIGYMVGCVAGAISQSRGDNPLEDGIQTTHFMEAILAAEQFALLGLLEEEPDIKAWVLSCSRVFREDYRLLSQESSGEQGLLFSQEVPEPEN